MKVKIILSFLINFGILIKLILLPVSIYASTFTVINENNNGAGSLRWAIEQANINTGNDSINFNIPCGGERCTILPTSPLPALTDGGTSIKGYSQPGSLVGTEFSSANLMVIVNGTLAGASNGLTITSTNNNISGLIINNFSGNGIAIYTTGARDNFIHGNFIGTNSQATLAQGNNLNGIFIGQGAIRNHIGAPYGAEYYQFSGRNIISGNGWSGVEIHGLGTNSNFVRGNYIGINISGDGVIRNDMYGVRLYGGAKDNEVSFNNVIAGNNLGGVNLTGNETSENLVKGNYIGTNFDYVDSIGNSGPGISLSLSSHDNSIDQNIIGHNHDNGILLSNDGTENNTIINNYIGIGENSEDIGNAENGILITLGASDNDIGKCINELCNGNYISGNNSAGISISGETTSENNIVSNLIGTDISGTSAQGNRTYGIEISSGSYGNNIGATYLGLRTLAKNLISGNRFDGILLWEADYNKITGNLIGSNLTATATIPNNRNGIFITRRAQANHIYYNTIVGSAEHGILITEGAGHNDVVINYIGINDQGFPLGNAGCGAMIQSGTLSTCFNSIGPFNEIAHNNCGVMVEGGITTGNAILTNSIHDNIGSGIQLLNGGNVSLPSPTIAFNSIRPLEVIGSACAGCRVQIFASENDDGEGQKIIGQTEADSHSGDFRAAITDLPFRFITATATDALFGTSEFSSVFHARLPFNWTLIMPAVTGNKQK